MSIVRLADRAVVSVAGPDAPGFLQGLLTQDMAALAPGHPLYAGLLSPQGKALFDMILFAAEFPAADSVLIDIAANRAAALIKRLTMYKMRKAVTIAAADLAVFAAWDGDGGDAPSDPRDPALGRRWLDVPEGEDGSAAYAAHRRAIGVPGSNEIGEDQLLWLETGADLLHGVSFTKGCYVGQENTARMHHRDKVRRRLVPISVAGGGGGGDGTIRDSAGRSAGSQRGELVDGQGFAHLRLEMAAVPLFLGDAPITVRVPAWLAPELEAVA